MYQEINIDKFLALTKINEGDKVKLTTFQIGLVV